MRVTPLAGHTQTNYEAIHRLHGDGCSATCTVEFDWTCTGEPSDCVAGVPAVSQWGLAVLSLAVFASATVMLRRRGKLDVRRPA